MEREVRLTLPTPFCLIPTFTQSPVLGTWQNSVFCKCAPPALKRAKRWVLLFALNMASKLWATRAASYLRISVFNRGFATVIKDMKYADSHEWVKVEGKSATIGITDHAQDHLGDVVYVELPDEGTEVKQGASFGAVESVKATSDINSPVSGKVIEVNTKLNDSPGLINGSPYENGWIIKVEMTKADEMNCLMDPDQYSKFCEEEDAEH